MAPGAEADTVAVATGTVMLSHFTMAEIPTFGIAVDLTRVVAAAHLINNHFLKVALITESVARFGLHRVMLFELSRMR